MEKVKFSYQYQGKVRNPFYKDLIVSGNKVVLSKKGKGSYKRSKKVRVD